jgi:hypothetical protein
VVDARPGSEAGVGRCDANAGPPVEDGLARRPGTPASVSPPQSGDWVQISKAPECSAILPGPVPPRLSWKGPDVTRSKPRCDPPIIDGQGDLAVFAASDAGSGHTFFHADGSGGAALKNGASEWQVGLTPRESGFVLVSRSRPGCYFARPLDTDANASAAIPLDLPQADTAEAMIPNPLGGYVEQRVATDGLQSPKQLYLQLRWLDDGLHPVGQWQTAIAWTNWEQVIYRRIVVDRRGKALVLSFLHPPSFGAPPPPAQWIFSARWMGPNGPLTDAFEPAAPRFMPASSNGSVRFAGWGTILPLRDGGLAMFQVEARPESGGTISPTGWYAFYPTGQARAAVPPGWLQPYDGSLQLLAQANAYAALRRDANTCARNVLLVAPSGRTCFALPLDRSEICGGKDAVAPDGTVVLQRDCQLQWWPGLARPRATSSLARTTVDSR